MRGSVLLPSRTNDFETACRRLVALGATAGDEQLAAILEVVCLVPMPAVDLQPLLQRASGMDKSFHQLVGALEFRAGRYAEAEPDLTPGIYIDPEGKDATCLCFVTMNYLKRGLREQATQAFQRAHSWVALANQERTFEARGELLPWKRRFDLQVLHAQAEAALSTTKLPGNELKDPSLE